ncbi:MAG: hypothetical protein NTU85_02750 [Candidatus Kaiserbacteria bacterium]|nr:hypothetical protein [Candidatus Kaiserbacteria bacterium]
MHNFFSLFSFSLPKICFGTITGLVVIYIGLIAVVMSYATLTIEFSQSVRNDEAKVATLESRYLKIVEHTTAIDYAAAGYALPIAKIFVPAKSVTALR